MHGARCMAYRRALPTTGTATTFADHGHRSNAVQPYTIVQCTTNQKGAKQSQGTYKTPKTYSFSFRWLSRPIPLLSLLHTSICGYWTCSPMWARRCVRTGPRITESIHASFEQLVVWPISFLRSFFRCGGGHRYRGVRNSQSCIATVASLWMTGAECHLDQLICVIGFLCSL